MSVSWWKIAGSGLAGLGIAVSVQVQPASALERVVFSAPQADKDLEAALRRASLTLEAEAEKEQNAQSLFAAARADYGRLVAALYGEGYYSGVVSIRIDGREAAEIPPLDTPRNIGTITIVVDPGPPFTFSKARMKPYAPGTELPPGYRDREVAKSSAILSAADAGVTGWRNVGHAKADVGDHKVVADHRARTIDAEILLKPGPKIRFGALNIEGYERMRPSRIRKIAGFPTGEVYSPDKLETVTGRLRRTGVFSSVSVKEADTLGPGNTMDVDLILSEEKLRRIGAGAELSTGDGATLSGYWMHRNLFGGGERLRADLNIGHVGSTGDQVGYSLGVRLERPATPVTDASAFVEGSIKREELLDYSYDSVNLGFGLTRELSEKLSAEAGLSYSFLQAKYPTATIDYKRISLPLSLTWDDRDPPLDAKKGFYLQAKLEPFYGLGRTDSGARISTDARAFYSFGEKDKFTLAGRLQLGTVAGPDLDTTPPDYLFLSGGGGTVRGQPFQSLGTTVTTSGATFDVGGMSFIGVSGEVRADVRGALGAVLFYDAGYISRDDLWSGNDDWHSGAGLGIRYKTSIGPIRADLGFPVSGSTGDGPQIYVGIGQAF